MENILVQRHIFAAPLTEFELTLLDHFQHDFPLMSRPFAEIGKRLDVDEMLVIDTLQSLQTRGLVSRVGAVFQPNVIGVSTLAALAVPPARLEAVAMQVSTFSEVNHNYEREHYFNLWFVVTAASAAQLQSLLHEIEAVCATGPVLALPLLEPFHIDLGFALGHMPAAPNVPSLSVERPAVAAVTLSAAEQGLIAALQGGLQLVSQPFAQLGWSEADALATLSLWCREGVIKRFGVVVHHRELGFTANAMVVWDVPDALVTVVGKRVAESGCVSLCYRRPRRAPHWPFNLFCMIHGKDRDAVEQRIADLAACCELGAYRQSILFSRRRFKQCGAQYVKNPGAAANGDLAGLACGPC
jgi:DNA-binding Lrp family transcriptional regulator